ncbi:GNAT family N-acetyltransferase [Streptomyces sp. V2]|uniref:GNAT family N-acetyltransferase n=1 Tax=Streptomyces niveiscabiei TaxID=164115 RepID=A0ABW9I395_9ACTN|nr:GNAT family N-acetyltransferase [Streptomyces sp. V2]PWG09119.1 GNAT family N-acetyltransferase [Streptomyces sp. V2]
MTLHIGLASAAEVTACAGVIAEALRRDPVLYAFLPGEEDRIARLTALCATVLRTGPLLNGVIDVARAQPGGEIIGVAAWEGPDRRSSLWADLRELPRQIRAVGLGHVPSVLAQLRAYERARPKRPHWYLADIAVSDTARGLGVGSALLAYRLAAIDAQHLPSYLEATAQANQRLYERFGFRPTAPIETAGVAPMGMLRPADGHP